MSSGQQMNLPRLQRSVVPLHFEQEIVQSTGTQTGQQKPLVEDFRRQCAHVIEQLMDGRVDVVPFYQINIRGLSAAVRGQIEEDFVQSVVFVTCRKIAAADILESGQRREYQFRFVGSHNLRRREFSIPFGH